MNTEELGMYTGADHIQYSNDHIVNKKPYEAKLPVIGKIFPKTEHTSDPIVNKVIEKLSSRSSVGIKKYNTTLEQNKKDNFLNHAQEEILDLANYLEVLLQQGRDISQICKQFKNDSDLGSEIRKIYG